MFRCLCTIIGLLIGIISQTALAEETPSILILPFGIQSVEEHPRLQEDISKSIEKNLKLEGFTVVPPSPEVLVITQGQPLGEEIIRQTGLKAGAEVVLWGNVTWIKDAYLIKAETLKTYGTDPADVYEVKDKDMDNLYANLQKLTDAVSVKLLKRVKVLEVKIAGNVRIESDAILRQIKTHAGDLFSEKRLSEDLKAIHTMGYFDDIRVIADDSPGGRVITFQVKEKPTVRNIIIKAGKVIEEKKIKENLTLSTGSILNVFKLQNNLKIIESLYKEKKYYNVKVSYSIEALENNLADVTFTIDEGEKIKIKKIIFEGNEAFPDKILKNIIKTNEKGFFSWLTSSGEYNPEELKQDAERINDYYFNKGFIDNRVSDPVVEFKDKWIFLTFKIFEGKQFKVGKVDVEGDIISPKQDIIKDLKITKEEYFSRRKVQEDVLHITELYSDEGYAYPDIKPLIDPDREKLTVDIIYDIKKGKEFYFEKINISGNTRTRDKVIRRELKVYEHDKYNGKKLKRSIKNLHRLDFFEDVKVDQAIGSADDQMLLDLKVVEKSTGYFSFGAGYSSVENLYGTISLTERNLFGRAQRTELKAEIGGITTKFDVSFTEPWLFDIPLSAGVNLYNWKVSYDYYDKDGIGGSLSLGYPVYDFTRIYVTYSYDSSLIKNISYYAANEIKELAGRNVTSSVTMALRYDSRDKIFNPTEGAKHGLSVEYAGLGGDIGFIKYLAETGWYYPMYKKIILFLHGRTGFLHKNSDKIVPDYEKFYLGGINTVRGFGWQGIYCLDDDGNKIGGDKFVQGNVELNLPIIEGAGLMGVLFFDTGDVYKREETIDLADLNETAGAGFRWYSPMGPMRIEYGYILNPKEGQESGGRWEFSVGSAF